MGPSSKSRVATVGCWSSGNLDNRVLQDRSHILWRLPLILLLAALHCGLGHCSTAAAATAATAAAADASSPDSVSCQSCVYYANIRFPASNKSCATGEPVGSVNCSAGYACKAAFLQDSANVTVYAARSCERSGAFSRSSPAGVAVLLNVRTALYCSGFGCNNNWAGEPPAATGVQQGRPLHCWTGYGRFIDEFRLEQCADAILRMAAGNSSGLQRPVCMLAQFTRRIAYVGGQFEATTYLGQCVPHAAIVYGQNYPIYEYEQTCRSPDCNSDSIRGRRIASGVKPLRAFAVAASAAAPTAAANALAVLLLVTAGWAGSSISH